MSGFQSLSDQCRSPAGRCPCEHGPHVTWYGLRLGSSCGIPAPSVRHLFPCAPQADSSTRSRRGLRDWASLPSSGTRASPLQSQERAVSRRSTKGLMTSGVWKAAFPKRYARRQNRARTDGWDVRGTESGRPTRYRVSSCAADERIGLAGDWVVAAVPAIQVRRLRTLRVRKHQTFFDIHSAIALLPARKELISPDSHALLRMSPTGTTPFKLDAGPEACAAHRSRGLLSDLAEEDPGAQRSQHAPSATQGSVAQVVLRRHTCRGAALNRVPLDGRLWCLAGLAAGRRGVVPRSAAAPIPGLYQVRSIVPWCCLFKSRSNDVCAAADLHCCRAGQSKPDPRRQQLRRACSGDLGTVCLPSHAREALDAPPLLSHAASSSCFRATATAVGGSVFAAGGFAG